MEALFRRYLDAHATGDLETLDELLAEDFVLEGPAPEAIPKAGYLAFAEALGAAFPDMEFTHEGLRVEGDVAHVTFRVRGTHTGTLMVPGMSPIAPTGRRVSLPPERQEIRAKGGKIVRHWSEPVEGGGVPGILAQIGALPA